VKLFQFTASGASARKNMWIRSIGWRKLILVNGDLISAVVIVIVSIYDITIF